MAHRACILSLTLPKPPADMTSWSELKDPSQLSAPKEARHSKCSFFPNNKCAILLPMRKHLLCGQGPRSWGYLFGRNSLSVPERTGKTGGRIGLSRGKERKDSPMSIQLRVNLVWGLNIWVWVKILLLMLTVCPRVCYSTSLCLGVLSIKWNQQYLPHSIVVRIKWDNREKSPVHATMYDPCYFFPVIIPGIRQCVSNTRFG